MSIQVIDLKKQFGEDRPILDHFNIQFQRGSFTGLLGPSGCGKTTLLRVLAGLERAQGGRVLFDEQILSDVAMKTFVPPEKRNFSMVFQNYAIWPHLNTFENVAFPLKLRKQSKSETKQRVFEMLKRVQLLGLELRKPHELSGGQQQRVALARALVQQPRLLLLDEPLSNLDANLRAEMRTLIRELQQEFKLTAIIVTHDWLDAKTLSERVVVLNKGQIEQQGTVADLIERPASDFVRAVTTADT